ncbi:hypothetical protein LTR78_006494 [Recurvomyces mirabilis]|uniref:Uncharacterized protein n=1 Tax=Recurvomyces mirabilis TaxID=574656 RepID=A0AAE0WKV7_9PEZI|nr:hypothetical protein LTR78_006494 [Recurvomyces mirabilis]KAK5151088.1 hypothetical protein LTS14_009583 [Recurvomyces mirabilis]
MGLVMVITVILLGATEKHQSIRFIKAVCASVASDVAAAKAEWYSDKIREVMRGDSDEQRDKTNTPHGVASTAPVTRSSPATAAAAAAAALAGLGYHVVATDAVDDTSDSDHLDDDWTDIEQTEDEYKIVERDETSTGKAPAPPRNKNLLISGRNPTG